LTPGARIAAAIDILEAIGDASIPADDAAANYFRRRRYIGAKDRAQISAYLYAVLRHRAVIDWWTIRASRGEITPNPRSRIIGAVLLIDGWAAEEIAKSFDGGRFRPAPLSRDEERLVLGLAGRTMTHPEMPRAVANDIPDWLEPYLAKLYGKQLETEMAALNASAPLDLRVNPLKADRDTARRALAAEHIDAEPTRWSPLGLRVLHRVPLAGTAAFKEGLVEVQDEASQIAALLADARPGMRRVLSSERDLWVKHHAPKGKEGGFDRVFVDAPCLGIGSWRRNPDAKWRSSPQDLAELIERQRAILDSASRLVKPGGRLIYATCSLLREENEAQAEAFLAAHADFTPYPVARAWAETIGGDCPGGADYLRLTPAQHATDGFFVALFDRKPEDQKPLTAEDAEVSRRYAKPVEPASQESISTAPPACPPRPLR
jgi:16S rRNA (cytosine967-C5)-methyltransferase